MLAKSIRAGLLAAALGLSAAVSAQAAQLTLVHAFTGGADGDHPSSPLAADAAGNLYGTTYYGGANGQGTLFRLTPPSTAGGDWGFAVLYSFGASALGDNPYGQIVVDAGGQVVGATMHGGDNGAGAIYRLSPAAPNQPWRPLKLAANPTGSPCWVGLSSDGTNYYGECGNQIAKFSPNGAGRLKRQAIVTSPPVWPYLGANPLSVDANGNLFGVLTDGVSVADKAARCRDAEHEAWTGCGAVIGVFKSNTASSGYTFRRLWTFAADQAASPMGPVAIGPDGSLYGVTLRGGGGGGGCEVPADGAVYPAGCGTLFRLTPDKAGAYSLTTLTRFQGAPNDAGNPVAITRLPSGDIYGVGAGAGARNVTFHVAPDGSSTPIAEIGCTPFCAFTARFALLPYTLNGSLMLAGVGTGLDQSGANLHGTVWLSPTAP